MNTPATAKHFQTTSPVAQNFAQVTTWSSPQNSIFKFFGSRFFRGQKFLKFDFWGQICFWIRFSPTLTTLHRHFTDTFRSQFQSCFCGKTTLTTLYRPCYSWEVTQGAEVVTAGVERTGGATPRVRVRGPRRMGLGSVVSVVTSKKQARNHRHLRHIRHFENSGNFSREFFAKKFF